MNAAAALTLQVYSNGAQSILLGSEARMIVVLKLKPRALDCPDARATQQLA